MTLPARELDAQVAYTEKRIGKLRGQALRVIDSEPELLRRWQRLQTIPGVGEASGLAILGELAVVPVTLDERQWVAHSGLDPKQHRSGFSVEQKTCISKTGNRYLRAALYMSALVAVQHNPALGGFYRRKVACGKA